MAETTTHTTTPPLTVGSRVRRKAGKTWKIGTIEAIQRVERRTGRHETVERARVCWHNGTRRIGGGTETHSTVALNALVPAEPAEVTQ